IALRKQHETQVAVRRRILRLQVKRLAKVPTRSLPVSTSQHYKSQVVLKNRATRSQLDGPQVAGESTIEITTAIVQNAQVIVRLGIRAVQPQGRSERLLRCSQIAGGALSGGEILVAVHKLRFDLERPAVAGDGAFEQARRAQRVAKIEVES